MAARSADELAAVWERATAAFRLGLDSLHGPDHWRRVERTGLLLAATTGADVAVVRLFAALHDVGRVDEHVDPEHGARGAEFARRLRADGAFRLDDARFRLLEFAITHHADGQRSEDPTIGTCWDADRLDLGRVDETPLAEYMSTKAAKALVRMRFPREAGGRYEI